MESTQTSTKVPTLDLNFEPLKNRMDTFLSRFDDHVGKARQKMISERNDYTKQLSESREAQKSLNAKIEELKLHEEQLSQLRAKDHKELEDSRRAIALHTMKRDEAVKSNEALVQEIEEARRTIQAKREEMVEQKQQLSKQNNLNRPELEFWERILGLRIEGMTDDFIKFIFTQIDSNDGDREYYFVVDLRQHDYAISECVPPIPESRLEPVLEELNDTRQLNVFLRDMRNEFKKT